MAIGMLHCLTGRQQRRDTAVITDLLAHDYCPANPVRELGRQATHRATVSKAVTDIAEEKLLSCLHVIMAAIA